MTAGPKDLAAPIGSVQVTFDSRVYALPVVKKAAYLFLSSFVTEISQDGDVWACVLNFAAPTDASTADKHVREFQAEVLDQDLRATISRETEPLRNAILAMAFSRTGLQGSE